jgi:hypothetical protein
MNTHNLWTLLRNNLKMKMYRVGGTEGMPNVHYLGSGKFPYGFHADHPCGRLEQAR